MREMLGIMLTKEGYEVVTADSRGQAAARSWPRGRSTWSSPTCGCPTATASRSCAT